MLKKIILYVCRLFKVDKVIEKEYSHLIGHELKNLSWWFTDKGNRETVSFDSFNVLKTVSEKLLKNEIYYNESQFRYFILKQCSKIK